MYDVHKFEQGRLVNRTKKGKKDMPELCWFRYTQKIQIP